VCNKHFWKQKETYFQPLQVSVKPTASDRKEQARKAMYNTSVCFDGKATVDVQILLGFILVC
jgi:hypothetical protein